MPYDTTIQNEQAYASSLGVDAVEDKFYGLYNAILNHWFTTSHGYIIEAQVLGHGGKPEYFVIRHANGTRNPVMVVEIKRPNSLHTGGKDIAVQEIQGYMRRRFQDTSLDVMYGLAGVGLCWSVWKMERGSATMVNVQQWRRSVASDVSHRRFERVYNM